MQAHISNNVNPFDIAYAQHSTNKFWIILRLIDIFVRDNGLLISSADPKSRILNELTLRFSERCFQYASHVKTSNDISHISLCYKYPGFTRMPVILSNRNADVLVNHTQFFENNVVEKYKLRKLDTLFANDKRVVSILHIEQSYELTLMILEGASQIINQHRPLIIFKSRYEDIKYFIYDYISKIDYTLVDSALQPFEIVDAMADFNLLKYEQYFVALPNELLKNNLICQLLWGDDAIIDNNLTWSRNIINEFALHAVSGGISSNSRYKNEYCYMPSEFISNGLYPTEIENCFEWRWLGPKHTAQIYMYRPDPGVYKIEISILGSASMVSISHLKLFIDGCLLKFAIEIRNNITVLVSEMEFSALRARKSDYFELSITVPATYIASSEDNRHIGVCLGKINYKSILPSEVL
jgi:hypothetical protein